MYAQRASSLLAATSVRAFAVTLRAALRVIEAYEISWRRACRLVNTSTHSIGFIVSRLYVTVPVHGSILAQ
ncbi:hypothetical protein [Maricaulis sp. D1M11]|uniref:hypothetical protein n=1 Tax=Maricaulis sp. D1M11 TaxID=3076117 RepID=UPI0039B4B80A